ncbi:MAG: hypothetical protein E7476_17065 [Ruminococcaceae bacterium]|nr:hypothetical protein [Oscillospiraceae bacterium]
MIDMKKQDTWKEEFVMNWFRRIMVGRYGTDALSFGMMGVSLLLMLLARATRWDLFSVLAFAVLVLCYLRIFSRDTSRRWAENQRFLQWWDPIRRKLSGLHDRYQDSLTHRHFKCKNCGQGLRVPKGRGKIMITCPKCHQQFVKKT